MGRVGLAVFVCEVQEAFFDEFPDSDQQGCRADARSRCRRRRAHPVCSLPSPGAWRAPPESARCSARRHMRRRIRRFRLRAELCGTARIRAQQDHVRMLGAGAAVTFFGHVFGNHQVGFGEHLIGQGGEAVERATASVMFCAMGWAMG